eukprot:CFRG4165T1
MPQHSSLDIIPNFDSYAIYFGAAMLLVNFFLVIYVILTSVGGEEEVVKVNTDMDEMTSSKGKNGSTKWKYLDRFDGFVSYIPHWGTLNQVIALREAMKLAKALNRVLVVPPLMEYDRYFGFSKPRLENITDWRNLHQYYNATHTLDMRDVLDLHELEDMGGNFIYESDFQPMRECLIKNEEESKGVFYFHDVPSNHTENSVCLYNSKESKCCKDQNKALHTELLRKWSAGSVLLQMGSMFLRAQCISVSSFNNDIFESSTVPSNPVAQTIARQVVDSLGGSDNYVSVHIRAGDLVFKERVNETVTHVMQRFATLLAEQKDNIPKNAEGLNLVYLATDMSRDIPQFQEVLTQFQALGCLVVTSSDPEYISSRDAVLSGENIELGSHRGQTVESLAEIEILIHSKFFTGTSRPHFSYFSHFSSRWQNIIHKRKDKWLRG